MGPVHYSLHILHANWSNELNVEAKDASLNFDLIVTTSDRIHVRLRQAYCLDTFPAPWNPKSADFEFFP